MTEESVKNLLESVAASDRERIAPERVEARVMAGFRAQRASRVRRRKAAWGIAISGLAAAAILVGVVLSQRGPERATPARRVGEKISVPVNAATTAAGDVEIGAAKRSTSRVPSGRKAIVASVGTSVGTASTASPLIEQSPADVASNAHAGRTLNPNSTTGSIAPAREMVSEFFPLMNPAPPLEGAAILRVTVPASAMQAVGLPVREERLGDRVQADVLVGEEGLPRAIRFVTVQMR